MAALSVEIDETAAPNGFTTAPSEFAAPSPASPASGAAIVAVAAALLSLNRFGGLVTQAPRAFVRLALVVVWGWIGLSLAMWLLTALLGRRRPRFDDLPPTLGAVGRAHVPLVALAAVMFLFAGGLQLRWPVLVTAIGVVGWWFPRSVAVGVGSSVPGRATVRIAATAIAHLGWLATVGRHLLTRLGHLL